MGEIIICPEEHDLATRQKMEGYLAHKWGLATKLPVGHPYKDLDPQGAVLAASVALTGATVSDTDVSDPLTQSWQLVSKPVGAPDPTFSSSNAIQPTVTFTAAGTYELRLTASDDIDTHANDVTITVLNSDNASVLWSEAYGLQIPWLGEDPALNGEPNANPDGDSHTNLDEYIMGFDPNAAEQTRLIELGDGAPGEIELLLNTRAAQGAGYAGKQRRYRIEHSTNLIHWTSVPGYEYILGDDTQKSVTVDASDPNKPAGFYRAVVWIIE